MRENRALSPDLGNSERDYVFAVAMKYVKNASEADDVAQEALLLAHRHRASFAGRSRYSTWLYRVAATAALMHLRKNKRRHGRTVAIDERHAEAPSIAPSPESICAAREELERAARAAAALPAKYRDVFALRYGDGKSDAEVAKTLGLSLTAAKTRAFRARSQVAVRIGA